jgi:hypothetical protein
VERAVQVELARRGRRGQLEARAEWEARVGSGRQD